MFRFLNEVEFVDKYGKNWKDKVRWNKNGHMDHLLGLEFTLEDHEFEYYNDYGILRWSDDASMFRSANGYWSITPNMIMLTTVPSTVPYLKDSLFKENLIEDIMINDIRVVLNDSLFTEKIIIL